MARLLRQNFQREMGKNDQDVGEKLNQQRRYSDTGALTLLLENKDGPKSPHKDETSVINEVHKEIRYSFEYLLSKLTNKGTSGSAAGNYNSNTSGGGKKVAGRHQNSSLLKSVLMSLEHVLC